MLRFVRTTHRILSNSDAFSFSTRGSHLFRPLPSPSSFLLLSHFSHSSSVHFDADDHGVVRFSFSPSSPPSLPKRKPRPQPRMRTQAHAQMRIQSHPIAQMRMQPQPHPIKKKMSRKKKLNELRFYRLKARRKMNSPNPRVRILYKLNKAKRKQAWLIQKLTKFHLAMPPTQTSDPEILTQEDIFYLKRIGEKKKHYVPVGRRGVFGGVVLNMHLHWKNHETIKVVCRPCRPGEIHEIAQELSTLSKGIVIEIMPGNIIIFYRGKNYVQPQVMSPPDTLSKAKALEKYKYQQSLEHTSQFIEKLEKELEAYQEHLARYKSGKDNCMKDKVG